MFIEARVYWRQAAGIPKIYILFYSLSLSRPNTIKQDRKGWTVSDPISHIFAMHSILFIFYSARKT